MKILGDTDNIKIDRKLMKPQVERRRRERMNRSLENLRTLLLQGPEHHSSSQRRLEKAEILEHTVLFLRNSVAQAKKAKDEEEREKHQFMDGFSTCLQRAAHFLLDEGEARGLEGSVTATLCERLTQPCVPDSLRPPVRGQNSSSVKTPGSNAFRHYLQQKSVCQQGLSSVCRNTVTHANKIPFRSTEPNTQCHGNMPTTARPTPQHQTPVSQSVWRPWP